MSVIVSAERNERKDRNKSNLRERDCDWGRGKKELTTKH